jgi:hypothetical protein
MNARQPLKCPVCDKTLFEGFWVATVLSIKIYCKCKRIIEVQHDYSTRILQEQLPTSR